MKNLFENLGSKKFNTRNLKIMLKRAKKLYEKYGILGKNKKYNNLKKRDIDVLEGFQQKVDFVMSASNRYEKKINDDTSLYKWQKQRELSKNQTSLIKEVLRIDKQRELYCEENGIVKNNETKKWEYKK